MLLLYHTYQKLITRSHEEYLDIVMPMYNLQEYSGNYSMALENLWKCYRDEVDDVANETVADHRMNKNKTTASKPVESKIKIIGKILANDNKLDTVVVPL